MARSFIADFLVRVGSVGLRPTTRQVESLASTVDRVTEANSRAEKSGRNFNNTMEKGVIGTANSTKSFSKLAATMGGSSGTSLVGIYATLAANIFAVTAAFNALRSAAQLQQVLNGLDAAGNRVGLTFSVTARRVEELSKGMLSAEQSARSTAQFMAGGFKTDQLEKFTTLSRDISIALGRNMEDSMDRLTRGVIKLEPELLDELGIMTKLGDATAMYAAKLGKPVSALTQLERRQGFANAVLAEGELKFGGLAESAGDTTGYDRLAATFRNLTKDVFGFINGVLSPLINGIADSKVALVGMVALFASTIRGQLLPMLNDLGGGANKLGQALSQKAINDVGFLSDTLKDRDSDIKEWVENVENGTAKFSDFQKVHADTTADIMKRQTDAAMGTRDLMGKTVKEFDDYTEHLIEVERNMQRYGMEQTRATAYSTSSNAINLASEGSFREAMEERRASFRAFDEAVAQSNGTITKWDRTMFRTTTTLKLFGAAFLYALPYIGMIIAAAGALYAWWTKLTPEQKKYADAVKDFGEITKTTTAKMVEYNKIQLKEASASSRVIASTTLRAQAIIELVNAYEKLEETEKNSQRDEARKKNESQISILSEQRQKMMADRTPGNLEPTNNQIAQLKKLQKVADELEISSNSYAFDLFQGLPDTDVAVIKLTDSLSQLDQDGLQRILRSYGALDDANKTMNMSTEQWMKTLKQASKEMKENASSSLDAVKGMEDAYKVLDSAISKFSLAAVPSTPFDDIVKGYDAVNTAIKRMLIEIDKGTLTAAQFGAVLSGLGQATGTTITPSTQLNVQAYNVRDAEIQILKAKQENLTTTEEISVSMGVIAELNRKQNMLAEELSNSLIKQFAAAQKVSRELQAASITMQNQIKYLQAQRTTYGSIYEQNSAGLKAQYEREEEIRNMQIKQLENQILHNKSLVATAEFQINNIKLQKEATLEQSRQEVYLQRALRIENLRSKIVSMRLQEAQGKDVTGAQSHIEKEILLLGDLAAFEEQARKKSIIANQQLDLNIESIRNNISGYQNAALAIQADINAQLAARLTDQQKSANYHAKDVELTQKYLENIKEQQTILASVVELTYQLQNINDGVTDSLGIQVALIKNAAKIRAKDLNLEVSNKKELLRASLGQEKANTARARSEGDSVQSGEINIANLNAEIAGQDILLAGRQEQLTKETALQIIELARFDVQKEGLEWQKEALQIQQKSVDTARELASINLKNTQYAEQTARIRSGRPDTEEANESRELEVKMQAYKFAIDELKIKEVMIDLEYALLEAQRTALMEELNTRKEILLSEDTLLNENSPRIRQLTEAVRGLEKAGNLQNQAGQAKALIRAQAETLRLELDRASTTANKYVSAFMTPMQRLADTMQLNANKRRAEAEAQRRPEAQKSSAVITDDNRIPLKPELLKINEELRKAPPIMVQTNTILQGIATDVRSLASASGAAIEGPSAPILEGDIYNRLKTFKDWAERTFPGVKGELENHGGKTGDRRGIDFNMTGPGGLVDWTVPEKKAILDKIADAAQKAGLGTLWGNPGDKFNKRGVDGHLDHLHIDTVRDTGRRTARIEQSSERIARAVERPLQVVVANASGLTPQEPNTMGSATVTAPANDNGIAVLNTPEILTASGTGPELGDFMGPLLERAPTVLERIAEMDAATSGFIVNLRKLGPQGEVVAGLAEGAMAITASLDFAFKEFKDGSLNDKIQATAAVLNSVISTIGNVSASASSAKIATIDQEIAAEQRRDGKSAESVAKLASLEKKKEAMAKKQFNVQKKLSMASAVISTAAAVAGALAAPPVPGSPWNIAMAVAMGALGAAQLAIIAGTSYQSSSTSGSAAKSSAAPALSIGKRGDSIDLAKNNANAGGEVGYLRGAQGRGNNGSNYSVIGSKYGGSLPRGYGNTAFAVGENGPEIMTPDNPITVRPIDSANENRAVQPVQFNIQALDASGVQEILMDQRGNIIGMLREAANANGQTFLEDVNVNVYTKPRTSRL